MRCRVKQVSGSLGRWLRPSINEPDLMGVSPYTGPCRYVLPPFVVVLEEVNIDTGILVLPTIARRRRNHGYLSGNKQKAGTADVRLAGWLRGRTERRV
jgi:hypothetical protein